MRDLILHYGSVDFSCRVPATGPTGRAEFNQAIEPVFLLHTCEDLAACLSICVGFVVLKSFTRKAIVEDRIKILSV